MIKSSLINFIYSVVLLLIFMACSQKQEDATSKDQEIVTKSKENQVINDTNYKGIMMVEEMPALCVMDSASSKEASQKMQENYNKILKDVEYLGVKVADQPGCIFYHVSPEKIVFETFMILKTKPTKKPKYSQPVILERTPAMLYDHYGTFNTIHESYTKIEQIMKQLNYKQTGPAREIYVLNEDTAKWRTRIIIPVISEKEGGGVNDKK